MSSLMAQSVGCQGIEMTSAFGRAAEVRRRTTSAAFDANDPTETSGGDISRGRKRSLSMLAVW